MNTNANFHKKIEKLLAEITPFPVHQEYRTCVDQNVATNTISCSIRNAEGVEVKLFSYAGKKLSNHRINIVFFEVSRHFNITN